MVIEIAALFIMFPVKSSALDVPVQVQHSEPTFLHLSLTLCVISI